jgi:hypothetical protein
MKKIIPLLVVGMFVLTGFGAVAMPIEKSSMSQPEFRITVRSGFGLHVVIENIGDTTAYGTHCFISFILFNRSWQGPFPSSGGFDLGGISPGQKLRVHFKTVGFGLFSDQPNVYIEVGCDEQAHSEIFEKAMILGKFILIT